MLFDDNFGFITYDLYGGNLDKDKSPSLTLVVKSPALGPINPSFFIF